MKIISLTLSALLLLPQAPLFCQDAPRPGREYAIEAGDVINVNVMPATEFSKEVTVQPDGSIEIPMLGSIRVSGMKPSELEKLLSARFARYVSNPSISLNIRKFSSSRVAIIGQAKSTGYFEYREGMRLLDLIAQAGGTQDYPDGAKVRIFRKTRGEGDKVVETVIKADLEEVLSGDMDKNIPIASGDIVYIPRKRYSAAAKWMTDNVVPWLTLLMFGVTMGLVARKN